MHMNFPVFQHIFFTENSTFIINFLVSIHMVPWRKTCIKAKNNGKDAEDKDHAGIILSAAAI